MYRISYKIHKFRSYALSCVMGVQIWIVTQVFDIPIFIVRFIIIIIIYDEISNFYRR